MTAVKVFLLGGVYSLMSLYISSRDVRAQSYALGLLNAEIELKIRRLYGWEECGIGHRDDSSENR
jgi:hypothetical protein